MSVLATQSVPVTSALTTSFTASLGNYIGIGINGGASDNIVGGTTAQARNVISGNLIYQVSLDDRGTDNNVVQGNYIGIGADGKKTIPGRAGISLENGPANNIIGATVPGARNVIVNYGQ